MNSLLNWFINILINQYKGFIIRIYRFIDWRELKITKWFDLNYVQHLPHQFIQAAPLISQFISLLLFFHVHVFVVSLISRCILSTLRMFQMFLFCLYLLDNKKQHFFWHTTNEQHIYVYICVCVLLYLG